MIKNKPNQTKHKHQLHSQKWLLLLICWLSACTMLPQPPRRITLIADGQRRTLQTEVTTVNSLLNEANIELENLDRVIPSEITELSDGMTVQVVRVVETTETLSETLPFGRQVLRDATIAEGESQLLEAGQSGILEHVYRITLEDNIETERLLISETLTQPQRDEVILIGTRQQIQTVPISGTLAYLKKQDAWIMRNNNRSRHSITTLGDLDGHVFNLSPDGKHLIFTRAVSETEHINALWMVRTTESSPNPIPLNLNDVLWAQWASNSTDIAWSTAEATPQAPGWRGENDLWTASISEKNTLVSRLRILEPESGSGYGWWGTRYAWIPQTENLAYSQPDAVGIVDLRRKTRTPYLTFPAYRTYSSWAWNPAVAGTPNGDFLATVVHSSAIAESSPEESPVFDLWIIEAGGTYSVELVSEVGMWAAPNFSPDGETLLFGKANVPYQSEISTYDLCLVDRDGSNQHCIYPPGEQEGIGTPLWLWSPDAQKITFIQQGDIYMLSLSDNTAIPLTDEGGITTIDWQ